MRRVPRSIIEVAVAVVTLLSAVNVGASPSYLESRTQVAVGLFADRGLGAPHVSSVTFDPDDPFCGRYGGRYDAADAADAADASILLCFDSGTLIRDEGEPLHPVQARLQIHELAHAWMQTHTTAEQRGAFMDLMGCDRWNDPDIRWHRRGGELAAETFVWALTAGEIWPRSIASRDVDDLQEGFDLLTKG